MSVWHDRMYERVRLLFERVVAAWLVGASVLYGRINVLCRMSVLCGFCMIVIMYHRFVLAELHAGLFSRHASRLEVYVFCDGRRKRCRCFVRRDLSSMQRKPAKKEAWRPKCAAPRLVYDSALFFETFVHVRMYVTYYVRLNNSVKRKRKGGHVSG